MLLYETTVASSGLRYHATTLMTHDPWQITHHHCDNGSVYISPPLGNLSSPDEGSLSSESLRYVWWYTAANFYLLYACKHAPQVDLKETERIPTRVAGEGRGWERWWGGFTSSGNFAPTWLSQGWLWHYIDSACMSELLLKYWMTLIQSGSTGQPLDEFETLHVCLNNCDVRESSIKVRLYNYSMGVAKMSIECFFSIVSVQLGMFYCPLCGVVGRLLFRSL